MSEGTPRPIVIPLSGRRAVQATVTSPPDAGEPILHPTPGFVRDGDGSGFEHADWLGAPLQLPAGKIGELRKALARLDTTTTEEA